MHGLGALYALGITELSPDATGTTEFGAVDNSDQVDFWQRCPDGSLVKIGTPCPTTVVGKDYRRPRNPILDPRQGLTAGPVAPPPQDNTKNQFTTNWGLPWDTSVSAEVKQQKDKGPGAGAFVKIFADLFGNTATGYAKLADAQTQASLASRSARLAKKFPQPQMTAHSSDNTNLIVGGGALLAVGVVAVLLLSKKKKK